MSKDFELGRGRFERELLRDDQMLSLINRNGTYCLRLTDYLTGKHAQKILKDPFVRAENWFDSDFFETPIDWSYFFENFMVAIPALQDELKELLGDTNG